MSKLLLPDGRNRSSTAVDGKADVRDENVFSSLVLQHGGAGQTKVFTVPQGQTIPRLNGAGITAPTEAHQSTYSELTTNITKAGEFGSALGDAAVRGIGITIENAGYDSAGVPRTFGAGQLEVSDILSKTFFQLKIAGKKQIEGSTFMFPASGGVYGGISSTENAVTVASLGNGMPGGLRRLKIPVMVARNDTVEGVFGIAGGSALAFSVTTGIGQPVLVWFNLHCLIKGDVR